MKVELYIYDKEDEKNYLYLSDAGTRPLHGKEQYFRGGYIFTCPICGEKINSHTWLHIVSWERAIETHLIDKHNGKELARDRIELDLPEGFVINDQGLVDANSKLKKQLDKALEDGDNHEHPDSI